MQNLDTSAIEHSQLPCWFFGNSIGVSEEFMPNQHIPLKTCSPCTTALTWPIASCGRLALVMSSRSAVRSCSYNFQRRLSERWMVGMLSLLIRLQPWRCNKTRVAAIQPHRPTHTHTQILSGYGSKRDRKSLTVRRRTMPSMNKSIYANERHFVAHRSFQSNGLRQGQLQDSSII